MASTSDIRDIMDMGHDGPRQPAPKKKKKVLEPQPRLTGISREVQALMGDSVPPVAIVETPKYKSKPTLTMKMFKVRHWEDRKFVHGARKDGLQLSHWKRAIPGTVMRPAIVNESMDVDMGDGDKAASESIFEEEFQSEKWNVRPKVPKYTDDQYEQYFQSEDWSREETDYLLQLCGEYDFRWILIADRYDPADVTKPNSSDSTAVILAYTPRSMEALKSRYYTIASKMLESNTPASQMTALEFQTWERMRNFDAKVEITRKATAEKLFERTKEEAEEEKVLLEELHRITKNEEDFIKLRKELYSRLETAPSLRRNERGEEQSTAIYQTSQGLSILLQNLLAKEKRLKRPPQNGTDNTATAATPNDTKGRHPTYNRRETMDSQADDATSNKKGTMAPPVVRKLTPAEEVKYGVSHPQERLTSGVMFRHEKINRITTAKSQTQTQKVQSALTELGIPPRLLMPTERVCREFERLVAEVHILLDTRRVLEKVGSEIKVLEEQRRIRLGLPKIGEETEGDAMEVDNSEVQAQPESNRIANGEGDEGDEENTSRRPNGLNRQETTEDGSVMQDGDEDDDDAAETNVDKSVMADDDDDEDGDQSYAKHEDDDEGEEEAEEEDEDREARVDNDDDEEEDEDEDGPGLEDLERANQVTDDEDDDEDAEDANAEVGDSEAEDEDDDEEDPEEGDGDDDGEEGDEVEIDESMVNEEENDEEPDEVDRPAVHLTAGTTAGTRKRSASVLSDASKAGSTRSAASRKRRR